MYEKRSYREDFAVNDLLSFEVKHETTDLLVMADSDYSSEIYKDIKIFRKEILNYSQHDEFFLDSLVPICIKEEAPLIVKRMILAAKEANVGPMASVAGGIAEFIGRKLLSKSKQVVVENGGDIFIKIDHDLTFKVFAGYKSPFAQLKIKIKRLNMPLGICTSSGRIGPSLSFGDVDAACVISKDVFLADACATAAANMVKKDTDIHKALDHTKNVKGILGAIIIRNEKIGLWGDLEIIT